jgi:non-ribosomal peptide synthetase component F
VVIEHRSAVAFLEWARGEFTAEELSGVLASTSVCFDLSVFELFSPSPSAGPWSWRRTRPSCRGSRRATG